MKKHLRNKIIIAAVIIGVIIIILLVMLSRNSVKYDNNQTSYFDINTLITNRYIKAENNYDLVIIGSNKNEVENGYYDVKIIKNKDNLKIYINKLWKDNINYTSFVDEEYIDQIFTFIEKVYKKPNIADFKTKTIIKETYTAYQNNKKENKINENMQSIKKIKNIKMDCEDGKFLIEIT
ncbi:MAG: hypothetical protein RR922_01885 [Clostridia bacterium]